MDFATLAGFMLGISILAASLFWGGVPANIIFQPEAILIVIGGTLTSLLIGFSFEEINHAFASIKKTFKKEELLPEEIVEYITDAAVYIRTKGILAVQPLLNHIDIPFLQKGLQFVVDNQSTDYIRTQLITDMEVQYRQNKNNSKIFESAGGFAPTMGIIGAIVGLIQVMNMFHSPEQLGHGVASAFIAILYGVGAANLFLLPIAGKLKQRAKHDMFLKSIMLQGIISISEGENPTIVREKLEAYLHPDMNRYRENVSSEQIYADPDFVGA